MKFNFLVLFVITVLPSLGQTVGVTLKEDGIDDGLTLFTPLRGTTTYLINTCGEIVNSWESEYEPGNSVYLLEGGELLRTGDYFIEDFGGRPRGNGGIVEMFDWDGNLIWQYEYRTADVLAHHDIEPLPNGNILILAWDKHSVAESVQAGRDPNEIPSEVIWSEHIIEVDPTRDLNDAIVWEWYLWDHLVQDFDPTKDNFGDPSMHPEKVDLNYVDYTNVDDWIHINAIGYNKDLDQIILSARNFQEVWVIDHSTTTEEARQSTGGNAGKGGDLLFRWGNPLAYSQGTASDAKLFDQHNAQWVPSGLPDAGNIMIFNNGPGRPAGDFSSIEFINTGNEYLLENGRFQPELASFTYTDPIPENFYSTFISGVQVLPSGNLFICEGANGLVYEVTREGEKLWEYVNPDSQRGILSQGESNLNEDGVVDNRMFRAERYPLDYPAFEGRSIQGSIPIEQNPLPCETVTSLVQEVQEINVFPNPANTIVEVRFPGKAGKLQIRNVLGILYKEMQMVDNVKLDVSEFAPGIYFLSLENTVTKLVVK